MYVFLVVLLIFIFLAWFYRKPIISDGIKEDDVISPASGEIADILVIDGITKRAVYRMGILDNHKQINPTPGKVISVNRSRDGTYKLVLRSTTNKVITENVSVTTTFAVSPDDWLYTISQYAGFFAWRIRNYLEKVRAGTPCARGKIIGLIAFSSAVTFEFPANRIKLCINKGDKVKVGQVIGKIMH
jgi:hypothetical protein